MTLPLPFDLSLVRSCRLLFIFGLRIQIFKLQVLRLILILILFHQKYVLSEIYLLPQRCLLRAVTSYDRLEADRHEHERASEYG